MSPSRGRRAFVAITILITACSGEGTSPSSTDAPSSTTGTTGSTETTTAPAPADDRLFTAPAATGPIDSFTWATGFEAVSLDPLYSWNYPENTILPNMCETVLQMTPDLQLEPGLASDVDISDPLAVVLTIRDGVTFWNGNEMTADDVAFSLARHADPANGSYLGAFWSRVSSVDVTGDNEVTVTLREPDALFWRTLAMAGGAVGERATIEAKGAEYGTPAGGVMCTGPYEFTSWEAGGELVMTRYEGYWNTDLPRWAGEVRIRAVADDAALVNALSTGEIDGTFVTPVSGIESLVSAGAGAFFPGTSTLTHMLIPSLDGPLGDVRLRKALSLALDRSLITEAAWGGYGEPAFSVAAPLTWGYEEDSFAAAYDAIGISPTADLEAAKALVAEVGDVPAMTVWAAAESPSLVTTANYIADVGAEIGLTFNVETVPIQTYSNWVYDPASREATDIFQTTWWTDVPDPLQALWPLVEPNGYYNYYSYDNPAVVADLTAAFAAADDAARAELVISAQQAMFGDDMMWIPLVNLATPTFMGSRITGGPVGLPAYLYVPWAAYVGAP